MATPGAIQPRTKRRGKPSYKSGLEKEFREALKDTGEEASFSYEPIRMYIEYPSILTFYMPDWVDEKRKIVVETKGLLTTKDRQKTLLVKKWFPDWLIIFVFERPKNRITKKSKTTYAQWCDDNDIPWLGIGELYEDPKCLSSLIQKKRNGSST